MRYYYHGWIKERKKTMINKMKMVYFLKAGKYVVYYFIVRRI